MTRKHFEDIAKAFNRAVTNMGQNTRESALLLTVAQDIAATCKQENPRFDKQRFLTACGF